MVPFTHKSYETYKTTIVGEPRPRSSQAGGYEPPRPQRAPSPLMLHRKAVYILDSIGYHPNLVSLCSDHFCAYRKLYPITIYAF